MRLASTVRGVVAWVFLAAVATGTGIWATHFVAMLAYEPGYPVGYDAVLTIASLLVAVVVAAVGFALATHGSRAAIAAGGAIIGAGVALMHFVGMEALALPGAMQWDQSLVAASILIGVVLSAASLLAWHELDRRRASWVASGTADGCHLRSALHGHGSGGAHPRSHDGVAWLQHRRCNAGNRGHGRKHRGDAGRAGGNADHQPGRAHGAAQQPGARRRGAGGSGHRARRHDRERQSPHPPAHAADLR